MFLASLAAVALAAALGIAVLNRRRGSPYRGALSSSGRWPRRPSRDRRAPLREVLHDGATIRYAPPPAYLSGSRLLPWHLEVAGDDGVEEIRFARPGAGSAEITFGRLRSDSTTHVQLKSPTVSRRHASISRQGDDWTITNLSPANPVRVNDEELAAPAGSRVLRAGDVIEIGDQQFVYREE